MAIIEKEFSVAVRDIGTNNKITARGILSLLEETACFHSDIVGYGINQIKKTNLSWVLLHWKVQILGTANYNSNITIKTWSRNSNKFATYRDFEVYNDSNELIASASSKWVLINVQNGLIAKISPEIIDSYEPEDNKNVFGEVDIPKLKEPEVLMQTLKLNDESNNYCESQIKANYSFTVQRRDIDLNHHMHNLYYLDYALETLPKEVYDNLDICKFEIMYKNGAKLGDEVNCFYLCENASHLIVMKNAQNNKLNAIIKIN